MLYLLQIPQLFITLTGALSTLDESWLLVKDAPHVLASGLSPVIVQPPWMWMHGLLVSLGTWVPHMPVLVYDLMSRICDVRKGRCSKSSASISLPFRGSRAVELAFPTTDRARQAGHGDLCMLIALQLYRIGALLYRHRMYLPSLCSSCMWSHTVTRIRANYAVHCTI